MEPTCVHSSVEATEVVVAVAAVVTAVCAVFALVRWRSDVVWKENRDVARSLLHACVKVRDGFAFVRSPYIAPDEFPEEPRVEPRQDPEDQYRQELHIYENRLKMLADGMNEMEGVAVEAEVLWGSAIEDLVRVVRGCRRELFELLRDHLALVRFDKSNAHGGVARWEEVQAELKAWPDAQDDLSQKIRSSLQALLDLCEPRLKR